MTDRDGNVKLKEIWCTVLYAIFTNIWYNPCKVKCVRCSEVREMKATLEKTTPGQVHCPICTHTVNADIDISGKKVRVAPGQKCPRCSSTLDAACVVEVLKAA